LHVDPSGTSEREQKHRVSEIVGVQLSQVQHNTCWLGIIMGTCKVILM
jgi:hypothetical protein